MISQVLVLNQAAKTRTLNYTSLQIGLHSLRSHSIKLANMLHLLVDQVIAAVDALYEQLVIVRCRKRSHGEAGDSLYGFGWNGGGGAS